MVNKKAALVRRIVLSPYPHAHGGLFLVHPLPEFSGHLRNRNMIENEKSIAYSRTVKAFYLFRSRSSLCCNTRRVSLQKAEVRRGPVLTRMNLGQEFESLRARHFDEEPRSMHRWRRLQAFISTPAGQKRQVARQKVSIDDAPGATADTMDTRPRHVGFAADPFWYHVLDSARAIVFEWCGATRAGIAILSPCGTIRRRLCRGLTPRVATRR
jgi:hypothetical protein